MDRVEFDLKQARRPQRETVVRIRVNGEPLQRLARVVEKPHAVTEGSPKLAGNYEPLALSDIRSDRNHFLGSPVATWFEDGDTVLLGCPCGDWGCWPLTAKVEVTSSIIRWSSFRNGHRDWDLGALGPFEFRRAEYEAALAEIG